MRYVVFDLVCTVMSFVFALNFLATGNDTALIMAFMFWILSEIYRLRMNVDEGKCRIPKVY